ncbi:hypothetical protein MFMK1_001105 [Metallumcola ferriviriculae]|uniref:Glycosyltransferase n=1 Tax=Metallumcola ferriviriculae TaxID=3039180 RepID=A0AAU0ULP5_9FIRM|nr:hypothetical protein MFMK1_001105 [Desulfitibacteraceae bacterium MK1]
MLYFMGYTDSPTNWTGNFTRAVKEELIERGIAYKMLPPWDWQTRTKCYTNLVETKTSSEDVWLIGWAQSPAIDRVKNMRGRKYGIVVGLTAMPFEPAVLWESEKSLCERKRLNCYDKLFANSHWCKECICRAYPELSDKVVVTGFPIDFSIYHPYLKTVKEDDLVMFNQRFSLEKLHILELELAKLLTAEGYRVMHLTGVSPKKMVRFSPGIKQLVSNASSAGLEFCLNPDKETYHENLAKASVVITTSIADMLPSSLIEAIYMGAVPVAPNNLCFPEFVHPDNLYTPYDLKKIVDLVIKKPDRHHSINQYDKKKVVSNYLREMELI